ncbi:GNAT family N-acetyltransferase [Cellulosimicrobium funkei]|nr:GNAT family N-acetyltransferase [Cellulosimicrobium funkei]
MSPRVSIHVLSNAHVEAVAAASPAWAHAIPSLLERGRTGRSTTFVALRADAALGLAELTSEDDPELKNVGVLPAVQGQGIGTRLITAAEQHAAVSHDRIRLRVGLDNPRARRLYERLGYARTGQMTTVTYEYIDDAGLRHTATETDEWMVKQI